MKRLRDKFLKIGTMLGFYSNPELSIPKGQIDCVWEKREWNMPPYYFAAFEFETGTTGPQIVENLVKELSIPPPKRPRFLIQVYRDTPKNIEYLEKISSTLPIATKIIHNVGNDVEKASRVVLIEIFNWINEYVELPLEFVSKVANQSIPKIFHYGELSSSHLRYLDSALRYKLAKRPLWINSMPTKKKGKLFFLIWISLM